VVTAIGVSAPVYTISENAIAERGIRPTMKNGPPIMAAFFRGSKTPVPINPFKLDAEDGSEALTFGS